MAFLNRVKFYPLLLSLLPVFFCSHTINEKEPENNNRKLALKLEAGQKLSGSFYSSTGNDIDYVYAGIDEATLIKGELGAVKGVDSEILFFRQGEATPFKIVNDNKSSLNERFGPYLISPPGVVIAIRPVQAANDGKYAKLKYEFTFDLASASLPMEQEPNENIDEANPVEDSMIRGYYNNALSGNDIEKDFYSIEIPEDKKYRLSVNLSKVTGVDGVLRLYSKEGEKLLTVDNGGAGDEENIYSYGVQGPARLYLGVNSKDYKISDTQYYELRAEVNPYEEKYELEPNDDDANATLIKVEKIFGDFANDQDLDYYKYYNDTLEPVNFFAEVVPDSNFDIVLELLPPKKLPPLVFNDGGDEAVEGIATWIVKPLETIYLKVSKKSVGKTGAYTLNTLMSPPTDDREREPNNSIKTATPLSPEKSITGYVNPGKDQDYYKVKIPGQGKYVIELESPMDCIMSISILDVKGIKTEGKSASQQGKNISFQAILDPEGFILTSCENSARPLYKNPYQLRITKND